MAWAPVPISPETWTAKAQASETWTALGALGETWFDTSKTFVVAASGSAILTAAGLLVVR